MSTNLRSVLQRSWRQDHLLSVLVELTHDCNLVCAYCCSALAPTGTLLSTAQHLAFLHDLREMQVLNLTFSGGEPLLVPAFFELGSAAREMGFVVRVKSNGHALTPSLARRLKEEVDPFQVEVSLHGATPSVHDRQTGVPGSFVRLLANLREMKAVGLRTKINATLTAWNEHEIEGMFDLADGLALPLRFDPEVTPRGSGDRWPLSIAASREGVLRLFRLQFGHWEAAVVAPGEEEPCVPTPRPGDSDERPQGAGLDKHCGAGSSGIAVDPYGNVYPCVQWRRPCGNLHERSIREIWANSPALRDVRELGLEIRQRIAEGGPDGRLLNFCPGTAEATLGDPLRVYEAALRRADLLRQVLAERHRARTSD